MSDIHHEKHFEEYIVSKLKAQGWLHGVSDAYNKEYALYPEDLVAWVQQTQKTKWDKLVAMNGDKATEVLMDRLSQALDSMGAIFTLRRGFAIAGCGTIDLSEAAPEDKRNEQVVHRYKSNRLRVVQQLRYHPSREFAIDLVFFINGLAVATVELKTDFTQSTRAAMGMLETLREQMVNIRSPISGKRFASPMRGYEFFTALSTPRKKRLLI
jgi:type I restriction enzyme R subunit